MRAAVYFSERKFKNNFIVAIHRLAIQIRFHNASGVQSIYIPKGSIMLW